MDGLVWIVFLVFFDVLMFDVCRFHVFFDVLLMGKKKMVLFDRLCMLMVSHFEGSKLFPSQKNRWCIEHIMVFVHGLPMVKKYYFFYLNS